MEARYCWKRAFGFISIKTREKGRIGGSRQGKQTEKERKKCETEINGEGVV